MMTKRNLGMDCSRAAGMSLVEVMVAVAAGSLVLASTLSIFIYGLFSFAGMGNYAILTGQSRKSLDKMSLEMRQATGVYSFKRIGGTQSLVLTNEIDRTCTTYRWEEGTKILTSISTGETAEEVRLTGCEEWDFSLFQRRPTNNWAFYPTAEPRLVKLINMRWKCSRTILGQRINTENVVTAQIVLRNKP